MLLLMDIFIAVALGYSVLQSKILLTNDDPFILNVAMIFGLIDAALVVLTFLMIYEIKTDSSLNQRIITLERNVMEKGFNNRK